MSDKAERDLIIDHRAIRVNGDATDGLFEIRRGNDGDIYLVCEKSAMVFALTLDEGEMFANDILQLVKQMRAGGVVVQPPDVAT
jgi:hypothetical protein